jgi:hypothetical protein
MANTNKANGTRWETLVAGYLGEHGLMEGEADGRTGSADADKGDIWAGEWTIEAKAEKTIDLPGYLRQLAAAVSRRGSYTFKSAVWVKNRRHGIKDAYVVMSGENFRSLMVYVNALEGTLLQVTETVLSEAQDA